MNVRHNELLSYEFSTLRMNGPPRFAQEMTAPRKGLTLFFELGARPITVSTLAVALRTITVLDTIAPVGFVEDVVIECAGLRRGHRIWSGERHRQL